MLVDLACDVEAIARVRLVALADAHHEDAMFFSLVISSEFIVQIAEQQIS